jgi:transposase-like protein
MYQLNQIPSETQVKKYLKQIIFGHNLYCPECKSRQVRHYENRYRCNRCRIKFSLVSHTWLKNLKIDYQQFWLILWCWTTQIPLRQSVALTKISEVTLRRWFDLFRDNLPKDQEILGHLVQLDEAFFRLVGLMLGKQIGSRKLAYEVLNTTNIQRHHATHFLKQHVAPETQLNTDGASIYKEIDQWWPVTHKFDIHRKWEFSQTSEIEGMFGCFRTFVRRMYHHVTSTKLEELVREFCFRFSSPQMFDNPRYYLEKTLRICTN